ncbi:MAG: outer membrane beta-barrel protein [Bacteroidales bacterium]|nr:outer membrane beta-barrel protein [Bacteroidales bacterium]
MSDLNQHINPWDLPEHQPNEGNWEQISARMDHELPGGNLNQLVDDLPRHHPPSEVWSGIEQEIGRFSIAYFLKSRKIYILGFLGLIVASFFIYNEIDFNKGKQSLTDQMGTKPEFKIQNEENTTGDDKTPDFEVKNSVTQKAAIIDNNEFEEELESEPTVQEKIVDENRVGVGSNESTTIQIVQSQSKIEYNTPRIEFNSNLFENVTFLIVGLNPNNQDSKNILPRKEYYNRSFPFPIRKNSFDRFYFGFQLSPEFYVRENSGKAPFVAHVDVQMGYKSQSGWFVETGIGYAGYSCDEKYIYNFLQNELQYKYTKVDSIVYFFDSTNMQLHKDFVTSNVEIYDSIEYQGSMQSGKISSFLQLPLMAGYKLNMGKKYLFFKSGILLSVLMNERSDGFELNESGVRVINVMNQDNCSLSTNWQLVLGAGMGYRLGKKWSLAIEPQFRYYINSPYSGSDGKLKRPYGLNLRFGVYYNF